MSVLLAALGNEGDFSGDQFKFVVDYLGGRKTTSGERVSPTSAMTLAVYYACARNISEDLGKLPVSVYRQVGDTKDEQESHIAYRMLRVAPNAEMTPMSFKETLTHAALTYGNGYAEIARADTGFPAAMFPIHPALVELMRDEGSHEIYYLVREPHQPPRRIESRNMFHLKGLGSGILGYSVAQYAAESLGTSIATQKFGGAFFGNGTQIGGILEHPGKLDETAQNNLSKSWKESHEGSGNAFKVAVLEEGMKWHPTTVPPGDAQFLETRQFQVEEVCRWFRMPPHKVQHLLRATFGNIEHQSIEYVVDTLQPWITRWEEEIERKLLIGSRLHARFIVQELLRGDSKSRGEYYRMMFNVGAMTPNQIRAQENMNPGGPALDEYFMPLNTGTIEAVAAEDEPAPEPAPVAPTEDEQAAAVNLRPVIEAAVSRCNDKERSALRRAQKKADAGRLDLDEWYQAFSSDQIDYYVDSIRPILSAVSLNGSTEAQVRSHMQSYFAGRALNLADPICDSAVAEDLEKLIKACHASK